MYYELYMDVFFLENFLMDYLILLTAGKILGCTATQTRNFWGAVLGSVMTCLGILIPGKNMLFTAFKWAWLYILVNMAMVFAGLGIRKGKRFLQAVLALFVGGILLGGVMGMLKPMAVRTGSLFFFTAMAVYQAVKGVLKFMDLLRKTRDYRCSVTLYRNGTVYKVHAIIDTGNLLHDPVSGKPVHIIGTPFARRAWGDQPPGRIRYVQYQSIGREQGVLPVVELDRMEIHGTRETKVDRPLVAISQEGLTKEGKYEMILNPDIF